MRKGVRSLAGEYEGHRSHDADLHDSGRVVRAVSLAEPVCLGCMSAQLKRTSHPYCSSFTWAKRARGQVERTRLLQPAMLDQMVLTP